MKPLAASLVALLLLSASFHRAPAETPPPDQKVRTFINLLDYISKDYPNAVRDGRVISDFEYREMLNFSRQLADLHRQISADIDRPPFSGLEEELSQLQEAIKAKAGAREIAEIAGSIRRQTLALGLVRVTPREWPDLARGKKIFTSHCQSCHGAEGFGDGPLAAGLNPAPTSFRDTSNTDKLSPLQAYNTIRLGLEGTAMRPFSELSDRQVWDVAFYINAMNYNASLSDSARNHIQQALADTATLRSVALYTNQQWKELLKKKDIDPQRGIAAVRNLTSAPGAGAASSPLSRALAMLERAQAAYQAGDYSRARNLTLDAYLDGVEPVEGQIRAADPGLVRRLESSLMGLRSAVQNRVSERQFRSEVRSASLAIRQARELLAGQDYSFWVNFLLAASILLREGLEAFLIIMVILSVLRKMNAGRSARYVHGGWVAALVAGIGGWFIIQALIGFSSMQRELMEAIGAGIAVVMLLYIGFWLHSKTQAAQWNRFIREKVHGLLDKKNLWGLAGLSFVVVFREAFESIIFLSSISLKSAGASSGIFAALVAVTVIIAGIGYIFNRVSRNIPIRQLFRYSSLMLAVLAVILIGKAVRSLQEAGYIQIASLSVHWNIPTLGLYATWPTLLSQLGVLSIIGGLWYYSNHRATRQLEGG